jgi:hypothetical protein
MLELVPAPKVQSVIYILFPLLSGDAQCRLQYLIVSSVMNDMATTLGMPQNLEYQNT